MKIGGFQKNSLIDFPGTIACVVFTKGCNFLCPYCHNPDLVSGQDNRDKNSWTEQDIFTFLENRKGLIQGVVVSGGEPTLQKGLISFCSRVKAMGYALKLDTNGSHPEIVQQLIENHLVDYIAMDIKTCPDQYHLLAHPDFDIQTIQTSIRLIMDTAPAYEFRTTCCRPFISSAILRDIGEMVNGARWYVLQQCSQKGAALDPDFFTAADLFFSHQQIQEFKTILDHHVSTVVIR